MRFRPLSLAVAAALAAAPAAAGKDKDVKLTDHRSAAGRFVAKMPGRPKAETKDLVVGVGGQAVPVTTERSDGAAGAVFAVNYVDYPESFQGVPAKDILDGVRTGLKGTDGRVEKDDELFLGTDPDKVPGRDLRIKARDRVVRARVFLDGRRLYQVMVTGTAETTAAKSATDFLESFRIEK